MRCTKHIVSVQCSCILYAKMLVHNYTLKVPSKAYLLALIVMESFESLILQTQKILFMVKYYQKQKHYHTRPTLLSKDNNAFPQVLFFYIMKQEMVQYFIIFNTKRQKITLTYWTVFSSLRKEIL